MVRAHKRDWPAQAKQFLLDISKSSQDENNNSSTSNTKRDNTQLENSPVTRNNDAEEDENDDDENHGSKRRKFDGNLRVSSVIDYTCFRNLCRLPNVHIVHTAERVPRERPVSVVVTGDIRAVPKLVVKRDNECHFLVKVFLKENQDWRLELASVPCISQLRQSRSSGHLFCCTHVEKMIFAGPVFLNLQRLFMHGMPDCVMPSIHW
jgi:hypothetical protein